MILSKREMCVAAAAILAVAVFLLDRYLLTPFLDRRAQLQTQRQSLLLDVNRASALLERKKMLEPRWKGLLDSGLKRDASGAESRLLHAVREWAQESGLAMESVKPRRVAETGGFEEIAFQATGTGPMRAVARFLWHIETAAFPVKVKELQIGSRREGMDDLSLQLHISTLCIATKGELSSARTARSNTGRSK